MNMPFRGAVASEPASQPHSEGLSFSSDPAGAEATALRLAARDLFAALKPIKCIAVLPVKGLDVSFLVGNLALAFAEMQHKVALIEADLRVPTLADRFGISQSSAGLVDMLGVSAADTAGLYETGSWISLIPAGHSMTDVGSLLSSPKLGQIISKVAETHALTLVICPSAAIPQDLAFIAPCCEGVMVVARKDKTTMAEIVRARQQIDRLNVPLVYAMLQTSDG